MKKLTLLLALCVIVACGRQLHDQITYGEAIALHQDQEFYREQLIAKNAAIRRYKKAIKASGCKKEIMDQLKKQRR